MTASYRSVVPLAKVTDAPASSCTMAAMLSPSLTVIDQDPTALGRLAATRAVHRLEATDPDPVQQVTLPVRLLERASSPGPGQVAELFAMTVPDGRGRVVWTSPPA